MRLNGSMAPTLDSHTIALAETYNGETLFAGDIVVFDRGDNHAIVHRVKSVNGDNTITIQGDNVGSPDGTFSIKSVKARVVGLLYSKRN